MRQCPPCNGTGKLWGVYLKPCILCHGEGVISDPEPGQIPCHWCDGKGRQHGVYTELCEWCHGRGYRHPQHEVAEQEGRRFVFFVEAGEPRTAHVTLLSVLSPLEGEVRICDPYYGTGTLLRLDPIAEKPIRFLTRQPDSKEQSSGILSKAVAEFVKQHPNVEFKRLSTGDLHDRFILCRTELILLGHGLKDIGKKDSFIVRLSREIAADTIDEVTDSFDRKWANAEKLT